MGNTQTDTARQSGFEMVRIIAMIMIVANHMVNHGIFKVASAEPYSLWPEMSVFNQAACAVISCGGRIGVAVFFMISGYFMAEREKLSPRSVFSFLARVHFFGALMFVVLAALCAAAGSGGEIRLAEAARTSLCMPAVLWWFALAYLILLFLAPSINNLIRPLNGKAFFLLLILYIWYFFYTPGSDTFLPHNYVRAVLFYMVGALVRTPENRHGTNGSFQTASGCFGARVRSFGSSAAGLIVHVILFVFLFLLSGYVMFDVIQDRTNGLSIIDSILFWSPADFLNGILIPLCGLSLLMVGKFRFSSVFVNRISACTFSIYLLHEYPYTRAFLWHDLFKTDSIQYNSSFFLLFAMLDIAVIFLAGIAADTVRVRLGALLKRSFNGKA